MKRKLKINFNNPPYKDGDIAIIECGKDGIPKDLFWRRRLKEAEKNNCVEWVMEKVQKFVTSKKPSKSKSSKED